MKRYKVILSCLIMALMVTSFVGCGSKEAVVESTETEVVATPEPTVEPTPEPTPESTPTPEPSNEFASVEEVEGSEPVVAMYDVVTVVETKDFISYNQEGAVVNEGTETLYSDGTSAFDFNVTRHGYTTHFKFANVPSNMEDRAAKTKINFFAHRYYEKCEDGSEKHFWIRIIPAGETSDKLADLNSLDEAFLKQKIEVETVDMSTKQIFETEDYNALLIEYDSVIDSYEMR